MKCRHNITTFRLGAGFRHPAAFTLMEMLVAVGISSLMLAMTSTFAIMTARSTSGVVQQAVINDQAGRVSELIFNRVRFATSLAVDATGNTLTLSFDDDFMTDSSIPPDKKTYNDRDHYEVFQFLTGDGSDATTTDNRLIYKPRSDVAITNVLLRSAIRKLPNVKIFVLTNETSTVLMHFGLVDSYSTDGYQEVDIKTAFLARNSPDTSKLIKILPVN